MKKIKILVINNNSRECKIGLVEPHLLLYETYPNLFEIDIENNSNIIDFEHFEKYDYLIYHRCIGDNYDKCKELIQYLKNTNTKTVLYVDEFWQLPKDHPYYKQFNESKFHEKISDNIRLVDKLFCYNNEKLLENIVSLNMNCYFFSDSPSLCKYTTERTNFYKIGIKPNLYDLENIKLIDGICKYFNKNDLFQFILIGFDPRGITKQYNNYTGEVIEVIKKPQDTLWAKYEQILTNNYKICSPEYKDFLLKFLPNNKYSGDINKEKYKRVWYNEINDNDSECYCLLKPQIKNKYNQLKYDINTREMLISGFDVISTFNGSYNPKKPNIIKQWIECIKKAKTQNNEQVFIEIFKTTIDKTLENIKLMYSN